MWYSAAGLLGFRGRAGDYSKQHANALYRVLTQAAMRAAESESTDECPVKMKLVAPPLYVLNTVTLDKDQVRTSPASLLSVL